MTYGFRDGTGSRAAVAAAVLALTFGAGGCASGDGGGKDTSAQPSTRPSAPSATGGGPYPTPSRPGATAPDGAPPVAPTGTPTGAPTGTREAEAHVSGLPRPGEVDRTDADAVARSALTVLWTFDTTVDGRTHDAQVRAAAAGWLTDAYATRLDGHRPRTVPGAQWREWSAHRAHTTVGLEKAADAAIPADTSTEAWRQWIVTATPAGRDRWQGEPLTVVAFVHLTRSADGKAWRVADVNVR